MSIDKEPILRVTNFTAAYGDNVIIDNISFEVNRGEIFVILGGSGCGKSTVLKHMIGLYELASGKILIDGEDIAKAEGEGRINILKKIGVAYQSGALFGSMTVLENVRLALEFYTGLSSDAVVLHHMAILSEGVIMGSENKMP